MTAYIEPEFAAVNLVNNMRENVAKQFGMGLTPEEIPVEATAKFCSEQLTRPLSSTDTLVDGIIAELKLRADRSTGHELKDKHLAIKDERTDLHTRITEVWQDARKQYQNELAIYKDTDKAQESVLAALDLLAKGGIPVDVNSMPIEPTVGRAV